METHPPDADSRRAAARERLTARRRRVRAIRLRVAACSAGTFLAVSGVVLVQLVSGHDPALAASVTSSRHQTRSTASARTATTSSATTATTSSATTRTTASVGASGTSARTHAVSRSTAPSAVTSAAS